MEIEDKRDKINRQFTTTIIKNTTPFHLSDHLERWFDNKIGKSFKENLKRRLDLSEIYIGPMTDFLNKCTSNVLKCFV